MLVVLLNHLQTPSRMNRLSDLGPGAFDGGPGALGGPFGPPSPPHQDGCMNILLIKSSDMVRNSR